MADVITANFSHTYAGEELINELFYQPEENVPALSEMYRFIPVRGDKVNVYLPQTLRKILRKYTTCGFTAAGGVSTIVDKTLSVEKVKANLEECVDAWDDTIFAELMKPGVNRDDLSGTVIDNVIRTQYLKAARSDIQRIAWFADINDADSDWDQFDGWVTNALDNSSSIGATCFIDMDSTSFETGDALATDGALGLLKQMWEAQTAALRAVPAGGKKFYVTNTVLDNFRDTLEDQNNSLGQALIQDGVEKLFFRGVELSVVPEWDTNLADSTNPHYTGSGLSIGSNFIYYTVKDNLVFGSDVVEGSTSFKVRYADDDDEKMKLTTKFKLGVQTMHYELVCLAY
jgi:hypothetical protein